MASRLTLRKRARLLVLESLYAWDIAKNSPDEIIKYKLAVVNKEFDQDYYIRVFQGAVSNLTEIDKQINYFTSRPLAEISPIELALLRLSIYELKSCVDVPYKVVINESLRLAKKFGAQDSYKFINGILDKLVCKLRSIESNN